MVIFGIIELGLLLYNNGMLTHASRLAARTGVMYAYREDENGFYFTHLDNSYILDAAETFWKDRLITFGDRNTAFNSIIQRFKTPDYNTSVSYGSEHSKDILDVTLTYNYNFLFLKALGFGPITLRARTSMMFE